MPNKTKQIVKKHYAKIAVGCGCCCTKKNSEVISKSIGYSDKEIKELASANLGLGCGNPTAMASIQPGETILDLGSGAGFDCFIAAKRVGKSGKVIGVDMTEAMLKLARRNAKKLGYSNVVFKHGDIEALPIIKESVDVVISNCVINLAPNKKKVFKEIFRVLKKTGRVYVSDIVLLKPLNAAQRRDENLIAGCVGGALLKKDYLKIVKTAGFKVKILEENKSISKEQYNGIPLESLKIEAKK